MLRLWMLWYLSTIFITMHTFLEKCTDIQKQHSCIRLKLGVLLINKRMRLNEIRCMPAFILPLQPSQQPFIDMCQKFLQVYKRSTRSLFPICSYMFNGFIWIYCLMPENNDTFCKVWTKKRCKYLQTNSIPQPTKYYYADIIFKPNGSGFSFCEALG